MTSRFGFDVARAFADSGARLVLQSPEESPELTEIAAVLAESASDMRMFNDPLVDEADATRLVQATVREFGGLDFVINFAVVDAGAWMRLAQDGDADAVVSEALRVPLQLTEVAANRMRLVWTEGSVLNVVRLSDGADARSMILGDILRAACADLTRALAARWADHGIRINAVTAPTSIASMDGETQASDADVAAVAVQLAGIKSRSISGHVIDAAGAARRWC